MVKYTGRWGSDTRYDRRKGCLPCPVRFPFSIRPFPTSFWKRRAPKYAARPLRIVLSSGINWPCWFTSTRSGAPRHWAGASGYRAARCSTGENAGPRATFVWTTARAEAARPVFPPLDQALLKALACERVAETGQPLSRQSLSDLTARAQAALEKPISRSTVWRLLDEDALKPWRYRYWIFPRDPRFVEKAGPILDLYAGAWQGAPLGPRDYVLSADEKTSIQARVRVHPSLGPQPGRAARVEHEYARGGALQYLAAWDVRRGCVMGRCEEKTGIEAFDRLVAQVVSHPPYRTARRLFFIVDNGSSHRGEAAGRRLKNLDRRIVMVPTPVHASWLNQVEIYFSVVQRKVLTPNEFPDLEAVAARLALYEELTNRCPTPFAWKFDRDQLVELMARLEARRERLEQAAQPQPSARL
jgi:hypothetical protein